MNCFDKKETESNWEYCQRMAAEISAETLLTEILVSLKKNCERKKNTTFQGELSKLLKHGSGVRTAIELKYTGSID